MFEYNEIVLKHFRDPQNMGEIKNPDGQAIVGNPVCGDIMQMTIKVRKNKKGEEMIEDIKFKTLGCGAAVASSSMGTVMVKGKTLTKAMKLTNEQVNKALGGLPLTKLHCSNLAAESIHKAIEDYKRKTQISNPK
jgi:nitrogen fixation NifU-like protein